MDISQDTFERLLHRHKKSDTDPAYNELGICYQCEDLNYTGFTLIEFNGCYVITDFKDSLIIELVEVL